MNSSWIELVIDRASARPMLSATISMIRNSPAITRRVMIAHTPKGTVAISICCASDRRRYNSLGL
jgi:hypothetical protein